MSEMIRFRLRELLAQRGMSWYALAIGSNGRISLATVYRIKKSDGRAHYFDATVMDAVCDVLNVSASDLLERTPGKPRRRKRKKAEVRS